MESVIFILMGSFVWGALCYVMARNRGRDRILGMVAGAVFGLFAAIYYLIVGDTPETKIKKAKELVKLAK